MSYSRHLESFNKDRFTLSRYEIETIAMVEVIAPKLEIKLNYIDNVAGWVKGQQVYSAASLVDSRFMSSTGSMHDIATDTHIRNCIDGYNLAAIVSKINLLWQR